MYNFDDFTPTINYDFRQVQASDFSARDFAEEEKKPSWWDRNSGKVMGGVGGALGGAALGGLIGAGSGHATAGALLGSILTGGAGIGAGHYFGDKKYIDNWNKNHPAAQPTPAASSTIQSTPAASSTIQSTPAASSTIQSTPAASSTIQPTPAASTSSNPQNDRKNKAIQAASTTLNDIKDELNKQQENVLPSDIKSECLKILDKAITKLNASNFGKLPELTTFLQRSTQEIYQKLNSAKVDKSISTSIGDIMTEEYFKKVSKR